MQTTRRRSSSGVYNYGSSKEPFTIRTDPRVRAYYEQPVMQTVAQKKMDPLVNER